MNARDELLKLANMFKLKAMEETLRKQASSEQQDDLKSFSSSDEITLKEAMSIVDDLIDKGKIELSDKDKMLRKLANATREDVEALYRVLNADLLDGSQFKAATLTDAPHSTSQDEKIARFFEKYGYPSS